MKSATMMMTMMLLLGSTSLAVAECAWVLWQQTSIDQAEGWMPQDSFSTRDECEVKKQGRLEAEWEYWNSQRGVRLVEIDSLRTSLRIHLETREKPGHIRFICLVDTIDPREKR